MTRPATYRPFPRWPWIATWVVVIAAFLAALVADIYVTARIIANG